MPSPLAAPACQTLREPVVDRREKIAGFGALALISPEAGEAGCDKRPVALDTNSYPHQPGLLRENRFGRHRCVVRLSLVYHKMCPPEDAISGSEYQTVASKWRRR
jgi:hypothetical protein